jgi:hypothetical protein
VLSKEVQIKGGAWKTSGYAELSKKAIEKGFKERLLPRMVAKRIDQISPDFVENLSVSASDARSNRCPGGKPTHVLIDPPYKGTGGYAHSLSRADVVDLALFWRGEGCVVAVCEHVEIDELISVGFKSFPVESNAVGFGPRTASRSKSEMITVWSER